MHNIDFQRALPVTDPVKNIPVRLEISSDKPNEYGFHVALIDGIILFFRYI